MNYLTSILLFYLSEKQTFWMLLTIIDRYHQRALYTDLNNLCTRFHVLRQLMSTHLKSVHRQLEIFKVDYRVFAVPWFITIFSSVLPFQTVIRVLDLFFYKPKFIY